MNERGMFYNQQGTRKIAGDEFWDCHPKFVITDAYQTNSKFK
jgi:hypothetical protein